MGRITRELMDEIRARADIVEVVSETVSLKKQGKNYKGLCPFHPDKVPSFVVSPEKGLFHCFGCGAGGDVVKFLMLRDKLSFVEAVEYLAKRYGVPIPEGRRDEGKESLRKEVLRVNELALAHFRKNLTEGGGSSALHYLEKRGVSKEMIELFKLGYAKDSWDDLVSTLTRKGVSPELLITSGLAVRRSEGEGCYDFFRNRLIFPIISPRGGVVGFGGRTLSSAEPKYLNSPETIVFKKSELLFGLNLTQKEIAKRGYALLVEGYMDLIALYQAGFNYVVAPLGTSFTEGHARLLKRYGDKVIIAFDGDDAGRKAAARAVSVFLPAGFRVKVALLPEGLDPDSFVKERSPREFRELLVSAPQAIDFLIEKEKAERDMTEPKEKVSAINSVLSYISRVPNEIERLAYVSKIAEGFALEEELVLSELKRALAKGASKLSEEVTSTGFLPSKGEFKLLRILLDNPDIFPQVSEKLVSAHFKEPLSLAVFQAMKDSYTKDGSFDYFSLEERLSSEEEKKFLQKLSLADFDSTDPSQVESCLTALERTRLSRELARIQRELTAAQEKGDFELASELQRTKLKIRKEMEHLF